MITPSNSRPFRSHPKPWHTGSTNEPPTVFTFDEIEQATYEAAAKAYFRGCVISRGARDLALELLRLGRRDSEICVSQQALASNLTASERSVRRWLKELEEATLVKWKNRKKQQGWREVQDTNSYELLIPIGRLPAPRRTGGQTGRALSNPINTTVPSWDSVSARARLERLPPMPPALMEANARLAKAGGYEMPDLLMNGCVGRLPGD
jgi:hypothetical protein